MTLVEAIHEVEQHRCERIAAPGKWKVWREGNQVKHEEVAGEVAPPPLSAAA